MPFIKEELEMTPYVIEDVSHCYRIDGVEENCNITEQCDSVRRPKYICNCGRQYKVMGSLKHHKRYECGIPPIYQCSLCSYKAKRYYNLKRHTLSRHQNAVANKRKVRVEI